MSQHPPERITPLEAAEELQSSIDENIILDVCESNNSNLVHIETANEQGQPAGEAWATMTKGSKKTRIRRASKLVHAFNTLPKLEALNAELVEALEKLTDAVAAIDTTQNRMALIDELGAAEEFADEVLKKAKGG